MESSRNWQLICLSTAKLCAMIADYYCHFLPSNSAKLHIIQHNSEWHNTMLANPLKSLFWTQHKTQDTSKTAEDHASYKSCNLYQMYVCLRKNRYKESHKCQSQASKSSHVHVEEDFELCSSSVELDGCDTATLRLWWVQPLSVFWGPGLSIRNI